MKKWQNLLIICLALAALLLNAGCGKNELRDPNAVWGQADATEVDVNTKVPGRLVELYVHEGSQVKKGDKIAQIDAREQDALTDAAKAKVEAAKASRLQALANYEQAQRDFARYAQLYQSGAVSKSVYEAYSSKQEVLAAVYEQANASVEASEKALKQSSINLGETILVAPFDGVVTTKYSDVGTMISSGMPIVAIQSPSDNWVNFKVKETDLEKYTLNSSVMLQGRNPELKLQGKIVDISKKPNFATYRATSERGNDDDIITFNVKVQTNDARVRPGMRFKLLQG